MNKISRMKDWEYRFLNRAEEKRAYTDGYAIIVLHPNTDKAENALVEFKGNTPVKKRFPLSLYNTCIRFGVLPSEAIHLHVEEKVEQVVEEKPVQKLIVGSFEMFTELYQVELLDRIQRAVEAQQKKLIMNLKPGHIMPIEIAQDVEAYILSLEEIADVKVSANIINANIRKRKNERG